MSYIDKAFVKITQSLGKHIATIVPTVDSTASFCFEITDISRTTGNNGRYEVTIYTDGVAKDFLINGWTFSYKIEGHYHIPGTYKELYVRMNALDPKGVEVQLKNLDIDHFFNWKESSIVFYEMLEFYSGFEDAEAVNKYYELFEVRKNACNSPGEALSKAKEYKAYYELIKDNCDNRMYLEGIKTMVNSIVDIVKMKIEENYIQ